MCSTTPKTKAASPAVNAPAKIQKPVPGTGTGTPPANAFGGFQEHVPTAVFLSTAGTPEFLASAKKFYTYFGMQPTDIKSIEALVELLAAVSNTTIYKRLLVVSHAHPRGMIIPFFTGGVNGTNKEIFRGFARSDLDGLQVINPFNPPVFNWDFISIMTNIRANAAHKAVLTPLGLDTNDPQGTVQNFFSECFNYVFVNTPGHVKNSGGGLVNTTQRNTLAAFVAEIVNQLGKKIVNTNVNGHTVTAPQLDALKTMLKGLSLGSDLNAGSVYALTDFKPDNMNYYPTLDNAVRAVKNGFHDKIVQMRKRFQPASAIDIRGCRAGDEGDYLLAIREFFDRPDDPRLTVSAPRWFQSFPVLGWFAPNNRAEVTNALTHTIFSGTVGHDEQMKGARAWAKLLKVDPLHTDFWSGLFGGTPAAFAALSWRSNIPALFIPLKGLADLIPLDLHAVIAKLTDMFNVPAAAVPNASQIAAKDATALQTFMTAAKESLETKDGIYYYLLFTGLPIFFFNKSAFQNHEGLMVLKSFEKDAMQAWYKCMWAEPLPATAASSSATINNDDARHAPMLQDDHAATEWAICPATEFGDHIQTSP